MKKLLMVAMALIIACGMSFAEEKSNYKELYKQRQEIKKLTKKEFKAKVDKITKKEAKRIAKEGWEVRPGALPLDKQVERSCLMQEEIGEDLFPLYIMGESSAVGENYDAAKTSALAAAKIDLAGNIMTEVGALLDHSVGNKQLSQGDAVSITETIENSQQLIIQNIGRTLPMMECYRMNSKKNYEVLVKFAYPANSAKEALKNAVREELESKGNNLREKLSEILDL